MTPPAKRATSADVARAAGVSRATVSYVLNDRPGQSIPEATRRRVLEAARSLEYRPHGGARTLAAGRSDIVLLAMPDLPIGASLSQFVEELAAALAEHGLTLVIHLAKGRARPLPDVCATVGASAVIDLAPCDPADIHALRQAGAEVVLPAPAGQTAPMLPVGSLQAEHLISLGHRRLGYAMPRHPLFKAMATERLRGVERACAQTDLEPPVVLTLGLDLDSASEAVDCWAAASVTGVCAFNDETALAVLGGARQRSLRVPEDLAIVGADDVPVAPVTIPPLTTVRFDLRVVARLHAEALIAGLNGREMPTITPEALGVELVARAST